MSTLKHSGSGVSVEVFQFNAPTNSPGSATLRWSGPPPASQQHVTLLHNGFEYEVDFIQLRILENEYEATVSLS